MALTTLSEKLSALRTDRPDEWTMDELKRDAIKLEAERDELRAKLAAMESQEPAGKITKWLNSNTAICSGEGFAAADIYAEIYFRPAPAEKPPRITEQDARGMGLSLLSYVKNDNPWWVDDWLDSDEFRALLNKLNADREQVPAVAVLDRFNGDDQKLVECAVALLNLDAKGALTPHGLGGHARTIIESFVSRSDTSHSQKSAATDAERFCDAHCTWRDHHPDCPRHESELSAPDSEGGA